MSERALQQYRARLREALGVIERLQGKLAATQRALDSYEDARASYDQVEVIYAEVYPEGHLHVGGLERERCEMFVEAQLWTEAANACVRALDIDDRLGASLETKRDVYELLIAAETGRGRGIAADAARARLRDIEADIETLEP